MKPCERVGLDFVDSAPLWFVSTVDLAITNVTWTSTKPHGIGTTRTVGMRGGIVGDEEFLAWEPHSHMAFRFNEAEGHGGRHRDDARPGCSRSSCTSFATGV